MEKRIGIIYVLLAGISLGVLSTIVKESYIHIGLDSSQVSFLQSGGGAIILWLIIFFKKIINKNYKIEATRKQRIKLLFAGLPGGLTGLLYYQTLEYVSASMAILLLFQFSWMSNIVECILARKRMGLGKILSLIVLVFGTILASNVLEHGFNMNLKGFIFGMLSALCYCLFMFVNGNVEVEVNPIQRSTFMVTGSALALLIIFNVSLFKIDVPLSTLLEYGIPLGVLGNVIPPILFSMGVPLIGIGLSAILGSVELPVTTICSIVFLNDSTSFLRWVGIVLVLLAIIIPIFIKDKEKKE